MHGWFGRQRQMWMEAQWMMARHGHGPHGFGRGFGGRGGPGGCGDGDEGDSGVWRGRRLSSADLQLVLLALLKEIRATATS